MKSIQEKEERLGFFLFGRLRLSVLRRAFVFYYSYKLLVNKGFRRYHIHGLQLLKDSIGGISVEGILL